MAKSIAHAKVINRQHVRPAELENQKHLDCPLADAAHRGEACNDFIVAQFGNNSRLRNSSVQSFSREIAQRRNFSPRKSSGANGVVVHSIEIFRTRKPASGKKFDEASQNRVRRRAIQLLMRYGLRE